MAIRSIAACTFSLFCLVPLSGQAAWQRLDTRDIDIDIVSARSGRSLPQFPAEEGDRTYRGYLEARQGADYGIRVRNRSDRRIGLVITVDGRNILSGERSGLDRDERMYILGPYEQAEYGGWRTGRNEVNRFYFTDAPDAYAGRWGDHSAMGLIAVAAYAERHPTGDDDQLSYRRAPSGKPEAGTRSIAPRHRAAPAEPGTGFGNEEWSPARRVAFDPVRKPFARYFIKYEWRDTLCRMGIRNCRHGRWDEDRFAPYPPGYERWRRRP